MKLFILFGTNEVFLGPATPIGLNFSSVNQTTIDVVFKEAIGAERYNLVINPPPQSAIIFATAYQFTDLTPGTTYTITVQAFSSASVNPLGSLGSLISDPLLVITGEA